MVPRTTVRSVRRHFPWLSHADERALFSHVPGGVPAAGPARSVGLGLGATIYVPANRVNLVPVLRQAAECGAVAAVVCLEDSVATAELDAAEDNLSSELSRLPDEAVAELPMLFVRPRTPEHLRQLAQRFPEAAVRIMGACLPKFTEASAEAWFDSVASVAETVGRPFLAMPILEGPEVLYLESRAAELAGLRRALSEHRHAVAAVRIGATDLCSLLGLRRSINEVIYDLAPLRSCIADIVNTLGRASDGFVLSGPVWEYFGREPRLWKPQLRESLFVQRSNGGGLRSDLIKAHLDGLIREAAADRANGLTGKTVIHPSHVLPVNALAVPTFEEWVDASSVMAEGQAAGVKPSQFGNKMNETGPHSPWASSVIERAEIYGVLAEGSSFVDLIDA